MGVTKTKCPNCKAMPGATSIEIWKKSTWIIFPNGTSGDVCTVEGEHKQWTKYIQTSIGLKDVKWCGKCLSNKYNHCGAWGEAASGHFLTHEHESKACESANLTSNSEGNSTS